MMLRRLPLRLVLLLALVAVVPGPALMAQEAAGSSARTAGPDLDRIRERAAGLDPLNSLVVSFRDSIVVEEYFGGMGPDVPANVKSVSKTLLSALVGIAIEEGRIPGTETPLAELLPEAFEGIDDPDKLRVTLHDLLSMTTGLEGTSFGNYGAWVASDDWIEFALERPVVCERGGGCMTYSTGNSHLASAILTRATGMSTRAYFREVVFGPLGITARAWDRGPDGIYLGGNNMSLTPRELRRFGQLYLDGGVWEGRQIVPTPWVGQSWGQYTTSPWNGHEYGYFWWTREFGGETVRFAWGYGGQFIFVVPRMELVVVVTSRLWNRPSGIDHNDRIYDFLSDVVIPEMRTWAPPSPARAR